MAMPQKQFFCGDISATFAPISKVISAVNTANISTLGSMDEVPEPIFRASGNLFGVVDIWCAETATKHTFGVYTFHRFYWFAIALQETQLMLTNPRDARLCRPAKFGEDRTMRGRVIAYFRFSKWRSSAILDLV